MFTVTPPPPVDAERLCCAACLSWRRRSCFAAGSLSAVLTCSWERLGVQHTTESSAHTTHKSRRSTRSSALTPQISSLPLYRYRGAHALKYRLEKTPPTDACATRQSRQRGQKEKGTLSEPTRYTGAPHGCRGWNDARPEAWEVKKNEKKLAIGSAL